MVIFCRLHGQAGLEGQGIDLLDMHVGWAVQNVASRKMEDRIDVSQMSYQESTFEDNTSDGAYITEFLIHATDPDKATRESYRALRPGVTITYIEYEHDNCKDPAVARKLSRVNKYSSMPAFQAFTYGTIQQKLENAGFVDIEMEDLTPNILPMLRFLFLLAILTYLSIRLLGLKACFVNTMAAVDLYRLGDSLRFVSVNARKPDRLTRERQKNEDVGLRRRLYFRGVMWNEK